MARFSQYYIVYKDDFGGSHEWEMREEHLSALLKEDNSAEFSIEEGDNRKIYKHRVYHLIANPNIIVMRFANDKDLPIEKDFQQSTTKTEPSCFVIIDNRNGMRTLAIQNRKEAFNNPTIVANILAQNFTKYLYKDYCYSVEIIPDYYPEDLFKAWASLQQHIASIRFGVPQQIPQEEVLRKVQQLKSQGKDYFDDSLMTPILQLAYEAKRNQYKQTLTVSPEQKKTALFIDKNSAYMRNLITISAAAELPIELITMDGASFQCFVDVDSENVDKIINREFDASLLESLFTARKGEGGEPLSQEDREKIEEHIVEFINGMKHESRDEKKQIV